MLLKDCERILETAVHREDFTAALDGIEHYREAFDATLRSLPDAEKRALANTARDLLIILRRQVLIARCRTASELQNLPTPCAYITGTPDAPTIQVRY
jgi:hypothetical protein